MRNIVLLGLACGGGLLGCGTGDTPLSAPLALTGGGQGGSTTTTASQSGASGGGNGTVTSSAGGAGPGGGGAGSGAAGPGSTSSAGNGGSGAGSTGSGSAGTSSAGTGGTGMSGTGGGNVAEGPSCLGGIDCGSASCCENVVVPGGSFPMGRSTDGSDAYAGGNDELPEHMVTVASFALDTFEVTVARFRKFANAFDGTPPAPGAGAQPLIANSGWQAAWNLSLASSQATLLANLKCDVTNETWTDTAGANEGAAINCVSWFEAAAFCAWDGGRLPTEAEWEYAAAGGSENRLYPWGPQDPVVDTALANYTGSDDSPLSAVGSHPSGNGRWGHRDLAGGMFEWNLDWYDAAWYGGGGAACKNCADINGSAYRVVRGGSWLTRADALRSAARLEAAPSARSYNVGFRCAR